ncbi:Fic/DOC family protein [Pseudidiomarina sediminum]|uniref:Fic/DOC family protein n=1 Tax=Pseudidiomarina sediminum TaxID=431675 RepID=UPI001C96678C|nr:Fic family protein [Pseudidiomarina sediminum]MBY6064565.1 Fic family protein [Pseudidiomarina sediminum]
MRDKYGFGQDPYCYPNSDVLVNKLNIDDEDTLATAEIEFSTLRYKSYRSFTRDLREFTLQHLQSLHWHLFQDVYDWAGKVRTIDIAKGGTRFCTASRIKAEATRLFDQIPMLEHVESHECIVRNVASLYCEINLLHPFREGNGRAQRFFFEEMLFVLGYDVLWPEISQQEWIEANVAGVNLDLRPFVEIFSQAIRLKA